MTRYVLRTHILPSIDKIAEGVIQNHPLNDDEGIRAICEQVDELCKKHQVNGILVEVTLSRAIGAYHTAHCGGFGGSPLMNPTSEQRTLYAVNYIKKEFEKI